MIIKLLSIILFIVMISLIWEQCNDSTTMFFTLSIFLSFAWLTPSLHNFSRLDEVPLRYYVSFVLIIAMLVTYVISLGIPKPSNSICSL